MERAGVWALNGSLFVLGCIFLASTVTSVIEAVATTAPPDLPPLTAVSIQEKPSWQDRQQISLRNIFQTIPTATPTTDPEPDLGETKLPLELLGTVVADNPAESIAAIRNVEKREDIVVRRGELVYGEAVVKSIERRRVVLLNNGKLEELRLDKDGEKSELTTPSRSRRTTAAPSPRRSRSRRSALRPPAPARPPPPDRSPGAARTPRTTSDQIAEARRNPTSLLSDADVRPKYDEQGQMQGVEVGDISPGSLFEDMGFQNGDIIVEFNGIPVNSPHQSLSLLKEFHEAKDISMVVQRNGQDVTLKHGVNE